MTPDTAAALHEKLRRYRAEPGYGWLDAMQVAEEAARLVGGKSKFHDNIPALAKFLDANAPAASAAATPGMTTADLLHRVRKARNGAVHRGTAGTRLQEDIGIVLRLVEETLVKTAKNNTVGLCMVRGFLDAKSGESLASARDTMLRYDISTLPVRPDGKGSKWRWLTGADLACYVAGGGDMTAPVNTTTIKMKDISIVCADMPANKAAQLLAGGEPALLVAVDGGEPVGILTAFDLLYAA